MKCPACSHVSQKAIYMCPSCGQAFDRAALETLGHLEYLEAWLLDRAPVIGFGRTDDLLAGVRAQSSTMRRLLAPAPAMPVRAPAAVAPPPVVAPLAPAVPAAASAALAAVSARVPVAGAPPPGGPPAAALPVPAPEPAAPKAPPFDWGKVWARAVDLAVSGALLEGLLYLGAFMIVVSAAVLVVAFWNTFSMAGQLAIAAALPLSFYLAGWLIRGRLKLPVAGTVFTAIGALLVAVDFAAIYQLGGLASLVEIRAYWLVASCLCALIYAATAWRVPQEFFGYLTLAGLGSAVLALTQWIGLSWDWGCAALAATGAAIVEAAARARVSGRWDELVRAARRWPVALLPATQVAALLAPGAAPAGQAATFSLAALGYGLRAWHAPHAAFAHGATWSSIIGAFLALRSSTLPVEWYPVAAAVMSPAYLWAAAGMRGRDLPDAGHSRAYAIALYAAGVGLLAVAVLASQPAMIASWWAGVLAQSLSALVLAWCAHLLRRDWLAGAAAGFLVLPFSLATARLLNDAGVADWQPWLMAAWTGLALSYLAAAAALRRAEAYAAWLNLCAYLLAPLAALALIAGRYGLGWAPAPCAVGLTGALLACIAAAVMHDSGRFPAVSRYTGALPGGLARTVFLWGVVLLAPFWLLAVWDVLALPAPWASAAVAALAPAYLAGGALLARRRAEYREPPGLAAHALPLAGCALALADAWALLAALALTAAAYVWLAARYGHRLQSAAAVLASAAAFGQALHAAAIPPAYLAALWVALAWAYVLVERRLARGGLPAWAATFRLPLGAGAGAVWALGLALTINGTVSSLLMGGTPEHGPLILAQVLAVGLTILAAWLYRSRLPLFVEPLLAVFPASLFFAGYGAQVLGRPLAQPEYAYVWLGLALAQVVAAAAAERQTVRYAHGLWAGAYGLALAALVQSLPDRVANLWALGGCIGLAVLSQALAHAGRHAAFADLGRLIWKTADTTVRRGFQVLFLFVAAYAFPLWLVQLMTHLGAAMAWQGLGLALVAPAYVALGLLARRLKAEYTWPLYSAAYALTAIGALVSFEDEPVAIGVLVLDAAVYAASAYVFHQPFWLYLCNALAPVIVLLSLHNRGQLTAAWVAAAFMALAIAYFALGQAFDRLAGRTADGRPGQAARRLGVAPFSLPFYAPGYLLSAIALAAAAGDRMTSLYTFLAGALLYAASARLLHEPVFLYPAVWLAAVPYFLAMTLTPLAPEWYGVGWLPLIVAAIAVGRLAFHRTPIWQRSADAGGAIAGALAHPAMPFYLLAYALSVHMVALSLPATLPLTVAAAAAAAIYFASAALFRRSGWLYPGLLAAHLALFAFLGLFPSDSPWQTLSLPFLGMTWAVALAGYAFSRRFAAAMAQAPLASQLTTATWARPFFAVAAVDTVVWEAVALHGGVADGGSLTALLVGAGFAVLLGLFAMLWSDGALAYGAIALAQTVALFACRELGLDWPVAFACLGGVGLGLYILARLIERLGPRLAVWVRPLTRSSVAVTAGAALLALPTTAAQSLPTAAALSFAGVLYLAMAYRGRYNQLGYVGAALLEAAWALVLFSRSVSEPQLYAIPAGLYLVGVGYLERRRARRPYPSFIEALGLAVLLGTSFIQSLNGAAGFPYFVLLLVEALLVIWWGAARRIRLPFAVGLGASVLNVLAQVAVLVNVYNPNTFTVIFAAGLLLVTVAVFVERQRDRIIAQAREWREILETWD